MPTISKNKIVDDVVQIPVELQKRDSDLFVVSLSLPRGYFRDPFFIDSLAKSFNILKSEIKLPEEDELLARPVHYDEKDRRIVYTQVYTQIDKLYTTIPAQKLITLNIHHYTPSRLMLRIQLTRAQSPLIRKRGAWTC